MKQPKGKLSPSKSEEMYRTLLENLPQKIFFKDREFVYISCNMNYAKDLNITPQEITGKTDYDFYPKELAEKYRADDKRVMETGEIEDIEEKYVQNGKEFFVHTVKTPVRDETGNVIGILGIFWDVSKQKRDEEALRISEERHRIFSELTSDYVYVIRIESDGQPVVEWISESYERITGYTFEDMRARSNLFEDIHPDDMAAVLEEKRQEVSKLLRGLIKSLAT